jgi:hypothetical protein
MVALAAPGTALAARGDGASCVTQTSATFEAKMSQNEAFENWTSREPGTVTCTGTLGGTPFAGNGSYASRGSYVPTYPHLSNRPTCLAGSGRGTLRASVPMVSVWGGDAILEATYEFVQIGAARYLTGSGTAEVAKGGINEPRPQTTVEHFTLRGVAQAVPGPGPACLTVGTPGSKIAEVLELRPREVSPPGGSDTRSEEDGAAACSRKQTGSRRADRLTGTSGGDVIGGRDGDDTIRGLAGHDCLYGQAGNDRIAGGFGTDLLVGGLGRDRIDGGGGDDQIDAADGRRDRVRCGSGTDSVVADRSDRLSGCERVRHGRRRR